MRPVVFSTHYIVSAILILLLGAGVSASQRAREKGKAGDQDPQGSDVIKSETNVVTVPLVASDRNDRYVADLRVDELSLFEDGVKQEILFFATTNQPFHVVLMLDTSASTQEKLSAIQAAARGFVAQLHASDRTKIISFDDSVRQLSDFTSDRSVLEAAIARAAPGEGTKLYDAFKVALDQLARVKGRKAIVLFTDGVDYRSDDETYDKNLNAVEESGVIVYPIRFETRADTEALVRRQQREYGSAADIGLILGGPPIGTTPPTVPGSEGPPISRPRPGSKDDPYRLPGPDVILRPPLGRYPGDNRNPNGGRYPDDQRYPDDRSTGRMPPPDSRYPPTTRNDDRFPDTRDPSRGGRPVDPVSVMLDGLYATADRYLNALATASGGRLHRADTLSALPSAFAQIAAELRQQYSLGYSSTSEARDGKFRKIQVKVSRKDVVLRYRPGYRVRRDGK